MPDEPTPPSPDTPPPNTFGRRVGTGLAGETTRNDGSTILPEANPRPLEVIGDFEVMSKLGQGGMGAVYRARQVSLDRQVALKILPSHYEADPDYVSRFQREARVASSLSHPNLVKVYASGLADGSHYIAMELIEGETLSQWLKRGALPQLEALRIVLDVARALECGWRSAKLIHRDIKPGNIFLSVDGEVKLGDLGLAKIVGSDTTGLTHTGMAMGTPHYISPEQARGDKDLDFRADIYSLGCTLFQMLTKQTPYNGTEPMVVMNQHINAPPPAILKVMPQCPLPLARLVSKMMKKARRERPTSYEELIAAIESVRAQLDPTLAAPSILSISSPIQEPTPLPPAADAEPKSAPVPAKSKLPIYGCVGATVIAVAAFFLWPREEKLTKAQLYAHDHATELKAVTDAEAALAGATKDRPFVNTLGMKFVPVPILGGPTGGQRVLFSVWDTRVQDYEAFATETNREWEKRGVERGPTHPAVYVSWDDAQAFCAWLTEREQKAGKLGANEVYRLPSDHEWSCAVGIGDQEDVAKLPSEKQQKVADVYPWGTTWPPPAGAGNYAGEELQPALAAGNSNYVKGVIAGYNDGFVNTSPVGSFAENRFGLFDMGGNVWQWCEDWFEKEQKGRMLRGASWTTSDRGGLMSSVRLPSASGAHSYHYGFRCVLTSASSTSSAAAPAQIVSAASAAATKDAPFVNTLGMKFVPVPIIGGPTGGQRVLFSVLDTRVQDYKAFATETKRYWVKAAVEQGPTYPAVKVGWNDAQAFCAWLTERERKAGNLGAHEVYRLPTDHEWSCAVGIGEQEDLAKTPAEMNGKINDMFPWGTQWPPTAGAGNYSGEELQPELAAGKYTYVKGVIAGYNDGFVNTSPVGSFAANRFGLYDIGGNVWQWCEDWYDEDQKDRVLRGASWGTGDRHALLSSSRLHIPPGAQGDPYGFRCVLAASLSAAAAAYPQPRAWIDVTEHVRSIGLKDGSLVEDGEWLEATKMCWPSVSEGKRLGNVAVRILFANRVEVQLRHAKDSLYGAGVSAQHAGIGLNQGGAATHLAGFNIENMEVGDAPHELVIAAQGDQLRLWLDGKELIAVRDTALMAGTIELALYRDKTTKPPRIKKVEYGELEAVGAGQMAVPVASNPPAHAQLLVSTEPWQDVLHDPAKLILGAGAERAPEGLRLPDNHCEARFHRSQGPAGDGAIRMLATFGGPRPELHIGGTTSVYRLTVAMDGKAVALLRYDHVNKQSLNLHGFPLREPLQPGQDYELELRVLGETFTVKLNGETLGTVTDGASPERGFSIGMVDNPGSALVKALEVLDLAAPGANP